MRTRQHIHCYEGQDSEVRVAVTDEDGSPILAAHIIGARWVIMEMRTGTPLVEKLLDSGITMTDGQAAIWLDGDDPLTHGIYWHELSLRNSLGHRFPACEGLVYVRPSTVAGVEPIGD